jgi:predicted nuclease with TOPRIM domain
MKYKDLILTMSLLVANIGEQKTKTQKKLLKIHEQLKKHYDAYQEKIAEMRLDNASVDKDGNLILDEKGEYKFNKEGLKKLNESAKELLENEFEYKPIEVMNPEGLDIHIYLKGWVNGVNFIENEEDITL